MTRYEQVLTGLRKIVLSLPEAVETNTWGSPHFRVANKIFAGYGEEKGEISMGVKVGKQIQGVYLKDPRFYKTPYVGQHGWVSLRLTRGKVNWNEIDDLVRQSYRLIAPARLRKLV